MSSMQCYLLRHLDTLLSLVSLTSLKLGFMFQVARFIYGTGIYLSHLLLIYISSSILVETRMLMNIFEL